MYDAAANFAKLVFEQVQRTPAENRGKPGPLDVVVVAAWRRPEFLLTSLRHVLAAKAAEEHEYIFVLDYDYDPICRAVAEAFPLPHKRIVHTPKHEFFNRGNSYNLLEGYRYAHMVARTAGSDLVYLIEEDVWVARDYFVFHRLAHSDAHTSIVGIPPTVAAKIFQVVGFSIPLNDGEFGADTAAAIAACSRNDAVGLALQQAVVTRHHYTSVATSFDTVALDTIAAHAKKVYYENPVEYIKSVWGPDGIPNFKPGDAIEQDGLLNRQTQQEGWYTLSPRCPRAFHAGFTGYNRLTKGVDKGGSDIALSFRERYDQLAEMTPSELLAAGDNHCGGCHDVIPVPLDGFFATRLTYCPPLQPDGVISTANTGALRGPAVSSDCNGVL